MLKFHLTIFILFFGLSGVTKESKRKVATDFQEKSLEDCGLHPFQQDRPEDENQVRFKPVRIGKHGFILQRAWTEGAAGAKRYYVTASHFSNGFPRHLFSAMIKIELSKSEYEAIQAAFQEHPGASPKGRFAPFLVFSRQPMVPGRRSPNNTYGFCMKDFFRILNGERQRLYGGSKNVMYGNLRKWNPEVRGVFAPYNLGGKKPVVEIALGNGEAPADGETYGDVSLVFFDPHRPRQDEFVNPKDAEKYWLRDEN